MSEYTDPHFRRALEELRDLREGRKRPSRVVQIVTGRTPLGGHTLYALCENGTVWRKGDQAWEMLPAIEAQPQ